MRRSWTQDEIRFIEDNYTTMTDEEIGMALNRTAAAVATKRKKYTKCKRSNRKYTFDDVIKVCQERDYILISTEKDYHDALSPIRYICKIHQDKGIQTSCLGHFNEGKGCAVCGRNKCDEARKIDLPVEKAKSLCIKNDFTYINTIRDSGKICVEFICNKHKIFGKQLMPINNMDRDINGCKHCAGKDIPLWYIKEVITRNNPNVILLEDENRKKSDVKYKCRIHNREYISKVETLMAGGGLPCCNGAQSNGERKLAGILTNMHLEYEHQYTFDDCYDIKCLPFDIAVFQNTEVVCVIEFDGKQHFEPVKFYESNLSAEEMYEKTKRHDKIKNDYCQKNKIPLIRIPYYEFDNMESFLYNKLKQINLVV